MEVILKFKFAILLLILLVQGCTFKTPIYGLKPEYPESRYRQFCSYFTCTQPEILFTEVDSLQPTFKWEAFPRPKDIDNDVQGFLSRIRDVGYDLKIWKSENEFPSNLIYSRQNIKNNSHRIEIPLESCTKYFWSVRARFKINEESRVTEWGISIIPREWFIIRRSIVPNPNLHRFKTPCIEKLKDMKIKD